MKMLIKLIKINLLTFFDIHKLKNAKNKKELKKSIPMILLYLYAFGFLAYYIYYGASFALKGLKILELEPLLLVAVMALASVYLLFTTILKVNKTLFNAKDYPILLSLPIKKSIIISSKIFILYFTNVIFLLFFMIPTYIAYVVGINPPVMFHLMFMISLLFIPLVPTVIGVIIGSILTGITSQFKYKNLTNILINIGFAFLILYMSFTSQNMNTIDLANLSQSIVNKFNSFYPLSKMYLEIIQNNSILNLLLFIGISVLIFEVFKYIIEKFFDNINSKLNAVTINNIYKEKDNKINIPIISLYKKEIKKYFSSPLYVLNTAIGCLMLILSLILLITIGGERLDIILNMPDLSKTFMTSGPLIFGVFCSMSCTTHSTISLEGKNLWILKSIPVTVKEIFIAKILVNFTIIVPTIVICASLLTYIMNLSVLNLLVLLFTPLMYAFLIACLGLLLNLKYPLFDWVNEVKVIKQSMPSILTMIIGLVISIIPLTVMPKSINSTLYSFIIGLTLLFINIILYRILFTKGQKMFERL